jgi:excisionase family DNA binding protein
VTEPAAVVLPAETMDAIAERAAELVLERIGDHNGGSSPWLTIDEAADYLRTSKRTLERAIVDGRLRSETLGRRRILNRDDLDAFARAATGEDVAPTTPPRRREG